MKADAERDDAGRPLPDVRTRYAGDVSAVRRDQVQSYGCFLVRGRVCSAFEEKLLQEADIQSTTYTAPGHFPSLNDSMENNLFGQEKRSCWARVRHK